jgi:hypothetical protein
VPHLVFLTRLVFASLSSRRDPYLALAVAVAALLFYGLSAVPDANGGNWGEFQTFGYIGGIAHSPTYPLLTGSIWLVGHVFAFLEPAHAANLTNAGFAAAATLLLFVAARDLAGGNVAALVAAAVFSTAYSIWDHAVQAEAFSLHTAVLFGVVVALRAYHRHPSPPRIALVLFATSLSLTNHGLSIFMLPATMCYLLIARPRPRPLARDAVRYVVAFALGLVPWLYLLRARLFEVATFAPENESLLGLRDMFHLVIGKPLADTEVGGILVLPFTNPGLLASRGDVFATALLRDFGWPWLLIALLGLGLIFRRDSRLGVWIIITAVLSGLFTFTYQIPDYARYFTVHVALLSLGLAVGIAEFASLVCRLIERAGESGRRVSGLLVGSVLIILAVARVTVQTTGDAGAVVAAHRRHAAEMNDHAIRQILHMEPESVYLVDWTSSWHSRYLIYARGVSREKNLDVRTVNYATMGIEQAEDILFSGRHLYLQRVTADFERDFSIVPQGAFFQAFFGLELEDGDLVKGSDDRIYLIVDGVRSWIPTGEIFLALGYRWDRVRRIDDRKLDAIPLGPNLSDPG